MFLNFRPPLCKKKTLISVFKQLLTPLFKTKVCVILKTRNFNSKTNFLIAYYRKFRNHVTNLSLPKIEKNQVKN